MKFKKYTNILLVVLLINVSTYLDGMEQYYIEKEGKRYFNVDNGELVDFLLQDAGFFVELCKEIVRDNSINPNFDEWSRLYYKCDKNKIINVYYDKGKGLPLMADYMPFEGIEGVGLFGDQSSVLNSFFIENLPLNGLQSMKKRLIWNPVDVGGLKTMIWGDHNAVLFNRKGGSAPESLHILKENGNWYEVFFGDDGNVSRINKDRSYGIVKDRKK
jgi:hypothetical protein